jgi:integrase/recombinase XerD
VNIEAAVGEFMLSQRADQLSKSTLSWYKSILQTFAGRFAGAALESFTANQIRGYLVELSSKDYVADTINAHTRALHRFWTWAAVEYAIPNPMRNIRYPALPKPKPKPIRVEDVAAMFEAAGSGLAGTRNRAILAFLMDTGCRAAGLCTLRAGDVDIQRGVAFVTEKGNKTRPVLFTAYTGQLLESLVKRPGQDESLFYSLKTCEPLTVSGLYLALRRMAKRAGVTERFNPHSFRHLFAREYILAGGDLATLSKLLGHRDVSTTANHYSIFNELELRDIHEQFSPIRLLHR